MCVMNVYGDSDGCCCFVEDAIGDGGEWDGDGADPSPAYPTASLAAGVCIMCVMNVCDESVCGVM
jgi:hypothetical protein